MEDRNLKTVNFKLAELSKTNTILSTSFQSMNFPTRTLEITPFTIFFILSTLLFSIFHCEEALALTDKAQKIFERNNHAVFQIQVIDVKSHAKSVIGSGFKITKNGLFATNFHVISDVIDKPDQFRIEYHREGQKKGNLIVQAIDVANDLAILKGEESEHTPLPLGTSELGQGTSVFPMGNPLDVGMVIIEGTYNGLVGEPPYQQVLLSAPLNSGMSGGPAFDSNGNVVGVNVAIKGNDLSYLVPVEYLIKLRNNFIDQGKQENWTETIQDQILWYYSNLIEKLEYSEWDSDEIGSIKVPKDVLPQALKCWGKSQPENIEKNKFYFFAYKWCESDKNIYLSSEHSTGSIGYIFYWLESESLSPMGFYKKYSENFSRGTFYAELTEDVVTEFHCQNHFVKFGGRDWKAAYCVRRYKKYPKLNDLFLSFAVLGDSDRKHIIQISLSGLSEPLARRFVQKLLKGIQWNG